MDETAVTSMGLVPHPDDEPSELEQLRDEVDELKNEVKELRRALENVVCYNDLSWG